MVIYNYCSKCGRKIKAVRKDPILSLSLETTERAICSVCDPDSRWTPVYLKIEGEGKIKDWSYKVTDTKAGKGLLMEGPGKKSIYLAPLASKRDLEYAFNSLPDYIREAVSEFELLKKIKIQTKLTQEAVEKIRKIN